MNLIRKSCRGLLKVLKKIISGGNFWLKIWEPVWGNKCGADVDHKGLAM